VHLPVVCSLALLLLQGIACTPLLAPTPSPPAAGAVLQSILADCWGVSQLRELDGTRLDHTRAFECARPRLLQMTRAFPDAAEPHRLLAWGYYFALQDEDAARAEYERAAEIYRAGGRPAEQAEMLVQLASLAFKYDRVRGCSLLQAAAAMDASNARAAQLLRNFGCLATPIPFDTPTPSSG
jgi:hypothetical protein